MLNLFNGAYKSQPTKYPHRGMASCGLIATHLQPTSPEGDDAALASAGLIQHEQTAALRLFLLTGRRCGFDVLAQILAERTFPVGSLALARYQAGERATGSGQRRAFRSMASSLPTCRWLRPKSPDGGGPRGRWPKN